MPLTRNWFKLDNPGQPGFRRLEHYVKDSDGVRTTYENDWNADGTINQRESLLSCRTARHVMSLAKLSGPTLLMTVEDMLITTSTLALVYLTGTKL